jgi:hypothetical protein
MGRTEVPGQPLQKKIVRLHLDEKKLGVVACTHDPSDSEKFKIGSS